MKNILKAIQNYFQNPLAIQYAGKSIIDIQLDFRNKESITLEDLLQSLKEIERLPSDTELTSDDIHSILLNSEHLPSLCFSCYIITKYKDVEEQKVVERLIQLLSHENESLRRISARALLNIGNIEGLNAVVQGNKHGHAIRTQASWAIAKLGKSTPATIPALLTLIKDKNINWRSHWAAAMALASIGEPAKEILLENLDSENKDMRYYSAVALSEMKPIPIMNQKIQFILENDS